jgi:hypothetical protein
MIEYKNVTGKCPKKNDDICTINIEYIVDKTQEGTEYVKNKMDCDYKNANNTDCTRNTCPIYQKAK